MSLLIHNKFFCEKYFSISTKVRSFVSGKNKYMKNDNAKQDEEKIQNSPSMPMSRTTKGNTFVKINNPMSSVV
ncbi:hypothetical protein C0J52_00756 [Blattella germanica]|nr:hypothetical protein C0J52_00756 [Blattella germanica]